MKYFDKIQSLLPLGYLYLIILGILKETLFFYQLGINILRFSSIMDVLISPIATLITHPIIFFTITSIILSCYYLPSFLYNNGHKKRVEKFFELKKAKADFPEEEIKEYYVLVSIKYLAVGLLSVYLGYGMADGYSISNRIKNNKLKFDYKLNFNTGESEEVCLLQSNSLYYFYVEKGDKSIKIAPVSGIKNVVLTKNKTKENNKKITDNTINKN